MKQIVQDLSKGNTAILEAPVPRIQADQILIDTTLTLISAGTERMLVDFGKAFYWDKARQQPEKVKMVLEKIKTDGLLTTVDAVRAKLAQPLPLGYCHVGVVSAVGDSIGDFRPGDRVISNGPHADVVRIAKNLCVKIPNAVDDESAAFTVVASIGLQGIRLVQPTLGELVVVTGAGLIGLLTIQLLIAQGCRVLAIDLDDSKLALAQQFGAEICNPRHGEDPVALGMKLSRGFGVDAVIITASTQSDEPVMQAAHMSRKRGRIVLVGVAGLQLNRADFYEKELSFQVSCSYGPGRYAPEYENRGLDYPIGFVRWTEQRNFEACLDLMANNKLDLKPLITHRFLFENATEAYHTLTEDKSALGILLQYFSNRTERHINTVMITPPQQYNQLKPVLGLIGAGNYASRILIPAFQAAKAQLKTMVTQGGVTGVIHASKGGFQQVSMDVDELWADPAINTVVIATRHDSHATFVTQALQAGKHVFVEKPLALTLEQLADIEAAYHLGTMMEKKPQLMIGFNRRFAPHIQKMKQLLSTVHEPKSLIMTINCGAIIATHWTQDRQIGGGRIIGEACHFIDLMRYLVGYNIVAVQVARMEETEITEDKATITLRFADGSLGSIHYFANGPTSFSKERIEIFTAGRMLQLDNFLKLTGYGWPGFKKMNLWRQDKGQKACIKQFLSTIEQGLPMPIPITEIFEVAKVTINSAELIRQQ